MQKFLLASFALLVLVIPAEAQRRAPSDLWCREDDPIYTLGKSSVSPGEYGWLLP